MEAAREKREKLSRTPVPVSEEKEKRVKKVAEATEKAKVKPTPKKSADK